MNLLLFFLWVHVFLSPSSSLKVTASLFILHYIELNQLDEHFCARWRCEFGFLVSFFSHDIARIRLAFIKWYTLATVRPLRSDEMLISPINLAFVFHFFFSCFIWISSSKRISSEKTNVTMTAFYTFILYVFLFSSSCVGVFFSLAAYLWQLRARKEREKNKESISFCFTLRCCFLFTCRFFKISILKSDDEKWHTHSHNNKKAHNNKNVWYPKKWIKQIAKTGRINPETIWFVSILFVLLSAQCAY